MRALLYCVVGCFSSMAWAEIMVTASPVSALASSVEKTYAATVTPLETSQISAGLNAEIAALSVRPGDRVSRGDALVSLDCRDVTLARDRARIARDDADVQLQFATRQADRISQLAATQIASEELRDTRATEVLRAKSGRDAAEVALKEAALDVARCTIEAPFDAVVVSQLASVGTRVQVGAPILELVSEAVEVYARLPVSQTLGGVSALSAVFEGGSFSAPLETLALSGSVESDTGSRLIRFRPLTPLLPGLPGRIRVQAGSLTIDSNYLVEREGQMGVMVAQDGRALFVERPDAILGQPVDVSDLAPETVIIRDGRFRVRDGDAVVVSP